MRKALKEVEGTRQRYTGTVGQFGSKAALRGSPTPTILLVNVKDEAGNIVCDHLWFALGKQFEKLELKIQDVVSFCARSEQYEKGYMGRREDVFKPIERDYKLSFPTKVALVSRGEAT